MLVVRCAVVLMDRRDLILGNLAETGDADVKRVYVV